jgi:hypothetical protein
MANMSARSLLTEKTTMETGAIGGFARGGQPAFYDYSNDKLFAGPSWFTEKVQGLY